MNTSSNDFKDFRASKKPIESNSSKYPVESFPPELQQFIIQIQEKLDAPASFIGSTLLATFSTAIGTSMHVKTALGNTYMCIWTCLVGISSSGKSIASNELFKPIYEIQHELDTEREEQETRMNEDDKERAKIKQVMYSEGNVPTLVKELLKPNPKGILFDTDEILIWINGLNSYGNKDTGSDEQTWIRIWDSKSIRKVLSGNKIFKVNKPYVNIFGGIQPPLLYKLYQNDRDYSGFCYRILFAYPEGNKIALPNLDYKPSQELFRQYSEILKQLYYELPSQDSNDIALTENALSFYDNWINEKTNEINHIQNQYELGHKAGIFGKMKIYVLRFAGILAVIETAYTGTELNSKIVIDAKIMMKAIKLADYYQHSAMQSLIAAREKQFAPPIVIQLANLHKKGSSFQEIGDKLYPNLRQDNRRQRIRREFNKYSEMYPSIFGLKNS